MEDFFAFIQPLETTSDHSRPLPFFVKVSSLTFVHSMAFEDLKLKSGSKGVPIKLDVVKHVLLEPPFTGIEQWVCFANSIPITSFMSEFDLKVYLEYLKQGDRFAMMPLKLRKLLEDNHNANHKNLSFGQDGKIKG